MSATASPTPIRAAQAVPAPFPPIADALSRQERCTPPSRARVLGMLALVAVACAAAAAFAGRLAGEAVVTQPTPNGPTVQAATVGAATLVAPASWAGAEQIPEALGLDPTSTAAFATRPGLRAYAVATLAPADHPTLIPRPLRLLLNTAPPPPVPTRLAGRPAWRYGRLPASGGRSVELTVAATTAGSLAIACVASPDAGAAVAGCASDIHDVALAGASWLAPDELAARTGLAAVVERLDRQRVARRAALRRARTPAAQSRIARRLAGSYVRAASALDRPAPVVKALRAAARAHRRLAAAAASKRRRGFRAARRAVAARDAALTRALARAR
jgi:hypothetical protein